MEWPIEGSLFDEENGGSLLETWSTVMEARRGVERAVEGAEESGDDVSEAGDDWCRCAEFGKLACEVNVWSLDEVRRAVGGVSKVEK